LFSRIHYLPLPDFVVPVLVRLSVTLGEADREQEAEGIAVAASTPPGQSRSMMTS
jgi:hypothetical protein